MKTKYIILITNILLLGVFLQSCSEDTIEPIQKGAITGKVVKASEFTPVANAKITLTPGSNTTFSDEEGCFTFVDVEAQDYSISAMKEGFLKNIQAATVAKDAEVNVVFEMEIETALNRAPAIPTLLSPANNEEIQQLETILTWTTTDPDKDVIYYSIEIKNDLNDEVVKITDLTDTLYTLTGLKYGVKYFWQVGASDKINTETLSSIAGFKVRSTPENRYLYVRKEKNGNNVIYSSGIKVEDNATPENLVKLTTSDQNSWRPRKNNITKRIAFLRTSNNETHLFTMNTDGSDVVQVTKQIPIAGYNLNEIDFSWSHSGDQIIYPHYDKLYRINTDGSGLEMMYKTTDGSFITECQWGKEKTVIALKTNDSQGYNSSIFLIGADGNTTQTILSNVKGAVGGLDLTVDNKKLLYCHDISEYENADRRQLDTHIFLYNFDKGKAVNLSENKEDGSIDIDPRFSPNEAEVIFVNTSNDGISEHKIYSQSLGKEINRAVLFSNASMPDWE